MKTEGTPLVEFGERKTTSSAFLAQMKATLVSNPEDIPERIFEEPAARFFIAQIFLALDYLHREKNLIFGDLKPENILITCEKFIKLTDFGNTCSIESEEPQPGFGTQGYIAPEVLQG